MPIHDPLHSANVLGSIGRQDVADSDIVAAVGELAYADSSSAVPEMLYGREGWGRMLEQDPAGNRARAAFDYDWNFALTPRQRAEVVWRTGLADAGYALMRASDELVHEETKAADSAHLEAVRRRRMGGV